MFRSWFASTTHDRTRASGRQCLACQEEGEFKTAAEKFERNAHEAVYNTIMDERIESISRGNQELEKARGEAARMNAEADRKRREERYQADLQEAERRRNGGITEPAFFK
jgi:hypothetical protein